MEKIHLGGPLILGPTVDPGTQPPLGRVRIGGIDPQIVSAPSGTVVIEGQAGSINVAELVAEVSRLTEQVESLTSGSVLDPLIDAR